MTEGVKHKCVKCKKWKPAPKPGTSYFTEFRGWFCDDCEDKKAERREAFAEKLKWLHF